ncbi:MAG TPA: ABC transporter permease [bacterium]|nr:ABC transporter permease [bacterium]
MIAVIRQGPAESVIRGTRRIPLFGALRDLWRFRGVILAFAERNVRLRYKQAVFGVAWSVVQPLAFLVVFTLVFARISGRGTAYPAFAITALVPWFFVQNGAMLGANSLLTDAALLRKVYFPREIPVVAAVLASALDLAIGLAVLVVAGPFIGLHLSVQTLLILPLSVMLGGLAVGVAMPLAALNVYYRDFRYALPLFLQLWMFASPVAYPLTIVQPHWRVVYVLLNPAAGVLSAYRAAMLHQPIGVDVLAVNAATIIVVVWAGYALFKRIEPGFADAV